jgi:hypothetical protein
MIIIAQRLSPTVGGFAVRLGTESTYAGCPVIIPRGQTLTIAVDELGLMVASFNDVPKSWGKVTLDYMGRR